MVTIFELPSSDVLFDHVFVNLETIDIWRLRLTCRKFYELCWDFFSNSCRSLKISISTVKDQPGNFLEVGAGIKIMHVSKHLQSLEITGSCDHLNEERKFVHLLSLLVESEVMLKQLILKCIDLTCTVTLLDDLSTKCSTLCDLELCETAIKGQSIQQLISQILQHSTNNLKKLTLKSLSCSLNEPLPTNSLTALRHFSVSFSMSEFVNCKCKYFLALFFSSLMICRWHAVMV